MHIVFMATLLIITVIIHSLFTLFIFKYVVRSVISVYSMIINITQVVVVMLIAHLAEASIFAAFYLYKNAFTNFDVSIYFSLVTYATIGYGDVTLPQEWRLMGAVEGLVGTLMVGWSVAILVAILQRFKTIT